MLKIMLSLAGLVWCATLPAKTFRLASPDGTISVRVDVGDRITYAVFADDTLLFEGGPLGLRLRSGTLGVDPRLERARSGRTDRTFRPAVAYKSAEIRDRCNTLRLDFRDAWSVEFRAYDDGVAYRFVTGFEGEVDVLDEEFSIAFPDDYAAVVQQTGGFRTAYEEPYDRVETDTWGSSERLAVLPALVDTRRGRKILVTESGLTDYPCLFLTGSGGNGMRGVFPRYPAQTEEAGDRNQRILREADYLVRTQGTRAFPWRCFVVAYRDGQLVETTMTARLAEPCALADASWIEPGQVSWEFWNAASPYGPDVDFTAGLNTATYKYYIDFAARYGIPYLLLDEGWARDTRDPYTPNPELDLDEVIRYGRDRGVGVLLWMTWLTVEKHFELFEKLSARGVRGIKIDFMDRSDAWMVDYYERVAAEAARHRMVVSFHGSFKPAGLEYKYPNVLTYEGVRGMEQMGGCTPANSVWLPFVRNATGPMDYTPGAMLSMQPEAYCGNRPNAASIGTRAYQMALYVVFESGLQMLADNPTLYYREDACTRFIAGVPVTWDETRALDAVAGRHVVVARRKGDKWYIGAMNGGNEAAGLETQIALDFLAPGRRYRMTAYEDGPNAARQAMDYRRSERTVAAGEKLVVRMARNGGWAAVIE